MSLILGTFRKAVNEAKPFWWGVLHAINSCTLCRKFSPHRSTRRLRPPKQLFSARHSLSVRALVSCIGHIKESPITPCNIT